MQVLLGGILRLLACVKRCLESLYFALLVCEKMPLIVLVHKSTNETPTCPSFVLLRYNVVSMKNTSRAHSSQATGDACSWFMAILI